MSSLLCAKSLKDLRHNSWCIGVGGAAKLPQQIQSYNSATRATEGWRDSLLSIPKKWLSSAESVDEFSFPCALPKLPIPPLEQTMAEYVKAVETIITPAQLEHTKCQIRDFTAPNGLGSKAHQFLLGKREAEDNWVYDYWLNEMYMDVRYPLSIFSNPGMSLPPVRFTTVHDVARFAARLLEGIMEFKELVDNDALPQDRAGSREKNQPLCMAQYNRILSTCRRPGLKQDSQFLNVPGPKNDEHIIVFCRNQMYCIILKACDRGKLSEGEIASQILYVLSDAPCLPAQPPPLGLLTAETRDVWAKNHLLLLKNECNKRNIELIEKAVIVLCLDEPLPATFNATPFSGATPTGHCVDERDDTSLLHEMIHGGGSNCNSANRWFDKTLQIIICTDGAWGLCYEHSESEGDAVIGTVEKIYTNIVSNPCEDTGVPQHHLPPPERLEWVIEPEMEQSLKQASKSVDKLVDDLDLYVYRYKGYGKNFIKKCNCSPDAFIQLILQLAYYKLSGKCVATYESASTRRFRSGRVDCIRAAHKESHEWAEAMCQGEGANVSMNSDCEEEGAHKVKFSLYSKDKLRELFRAACKRQTEIMVATILGYGLDIPMTGLREASKELNGGKPHALFADEVYKTAGTFLLSTSQVVTRTDSFMGYGPVTPMGYGCSYNPKADEIVFCISSLYSCEETDSTCYAKSLKESLDMMKDLMKDAAAEKK